MRRKRVSEPRRAAPRARATDDRGAPPHAPTTSLTLHTQHRVSHRRGRAAGAARPGPRAPRPAARRRTMMSARPAAARRVGRASPPRPRALVRRGFCCAPLVMLLHTTGPLTQRSSVATAKCKTLQTHTHHTLPEMSRFLTALQLFLRALAVHAGTELLVLHVPRVPANDGRPPLSSARPC